MADYDESGLDFLNDSSRHIQNDIRKKAIRTPHSGIRTLPQGSKAAQLQEQMFRKNRRNNFGWRNEQLQEQMGRQFNPLKSNYGWNVQHNPKFMELRQALENQSSGASWMKPERKTIGEEEEEQLQEQIARQRNNFGWRNKQLQEQIDRGGGETPLSLNVPLPYGEVPGIPEDTPKINENNRLGLMNTGNLPAEMMLAEALDPNVALDILGDPNRNMDSILQIYGDDSWDNLPAFKIGDKWYGNPALGMPGKMGSGWTT